MCERDAPGEIPSMQVRSIDAAVSKLLDSLLTLHNAKLVGDETKSSFLASVNHAVKQQRVSKPVIVHSSLDAISDVCKEIVEMDQQTDPLSAQIYQKQKFGTNPSPIWVPTPKTGVPTHMPTDRPGTLVGDTDDRMIHPKIFKQIQKLSNHTFTLDACANSKGDNMLCS